MFARTVINQDGDGAKSTYSEPFSTMKIFARMYEVVRHEYHVAWLETSKSVNSD
jgi:hypothetical protein